MVTIVEIAEGIRVTLERALVVLESDPQEAREMIEDTLEDLRLIETGGYLDNDSRALHGGEGE